MADARSFCTGCGIELSPHNLTRLCLECAHIERDRRRGFVATEVSLDEARRNFMDVFGARYRQVNADTVYNRGACRQCARFRARHDTGRCEWCSGPRRFPAKRSKKRSPSTEGVR